MEESALQECQKAIGYRFKDLHMLEQALTHASAADNRVLSNERLEFLGDAILGMVICHDLYNRFPEYLEGELTKVKSMIVSRRTCAEVAERIGLTRYLQTGKGMAGQRKLPSSCVAAAVEAMIGAVFLDGGGEAGAEVDPEMFRAFAGGSGRRGAPGEFQEHFAAVFSAHAEHDAVV